MSVRGLAEVLPTHPSPLAAALAVLQKKTPRNRSVFCNKHHKEIAGVGKRKRALGKGQGRTAAAASEPVSACTSAAAVLFPNLAEPHGL